MLQIFFIEMLKLLGEAILAVAVEAFVKQIWRRIGIYYGQKRRMLGSRRK